MDNPSIDAIKGIGPRKSKLFKKLGLETFRDLISFYPYRYVDRRKVKHVHDVESDEETIIKCKVTQVSEKYIPKRRQKIVVLNVADSFATGEIVFFSQYVLKAFTEGESYYFFGKIERYGAFFKMVHPEFSSVNDDSFLKIVPIYPLTQGITQQEMTRAHETALKFLLPQIEESLPESMVEQAKLCQLQTALWHIHFPSDERALKVARYRLVYEELFMLQLKLVILKRNYHKQNAPIFKANAQVVDFINRLPFHLTKAQTSTIEAIQKDFESGYSMNRLVQGDVGSGKTIVAFIALYTAVTNGYQGALMAPTTVLAEQHYQSIKAYFKDELKIAFLSSNVKKKDKALIKEQIEAGQIDIVIGTHALIQEDVIFSNLGLVVTDEQHRFGVRTRLSVNLKGDSPHTMIMSATPIPRTLSLILHGDMDISIMDELPAGRKEIKTHFVKASKYDEMYDFISSAVHEGRQAYFVCPLVEDSESLDLKSAESLYEELQMRYSEFTVGLVHGKMKNIEKESVMNAFKQGQIDILVSTTVIEVGINVPNASIMVICNTERFGLAQLHQLRGRVGRGSAQSYCFLLSQKLSKTAKERIEMMIKTNDGFKIADKDLEMRGPGEVFGVRQHGLPELKLANLLKHQKILKEAQKHIKLLMEEYQLGNQEIVNFVNTQCKNIEEQFTL